MMIMKNERNICPTMPIEGDAVGTLMSATDLSADADMSQREYSLGSTFGRYGLKQRAVVGRLWKKANKQKESSYTMNEIPMRLTA